LQLARQSGIPVRESPMAESRLSDITEAFITNTSFEVAPVIQIDNKPVGKGVPGPVTTLLREKFQADLITMKG